MVDLKKGSPWESVTLTTLSRDRHVFGELLNEARQLAIDLQEGKTVVYTCWGLEWRPFGQPRRKRPLSSVILDVGVKERIVSDVRDFLSASKYYYERGTFSYGKISKLRHPISSRIPPPWTSWKWKDEFHPGFGR
jgi:mitochondrial chaperone BCS1